MTIDEKVERLGTIGAHKHLTPELHEERARLTDELFKAGALSDVDRFAWNNLIIGFEFAEARYEEIYSAAFGAQLRKPHS